jgi:hypothetical protein
MNVTEALQDLNAHEETLREQRLVTNSLRIENDAICVGNERRRLSSDALTRLCKRVSAPPAYLLDLDSEVRAKLLQYHLDRGDLHSDSVVIISRDDECLGFARPDLCRLTGPEVLQAVLDGLSVPEITVNRLQLCDNHLLQLELVSQGANTEVAPGDVLLAGLKVTHSLIGDQATWVESFILRLVCKNGLTHRECSSQRSSRTRQLPVHRTDARQLQIDQVRRLTAGTWTSLRNRLQALQGLQGETIDAENLFAHWLERARLSGRQFLPLLRDAWQEEGGRPNAYDAMNALTRVATHAPDLSIRQRRTLSGLAGLLAFRRWHLCPRCFSVLSDRSAASVDRDDSTKQLHNISHDHDSHSEKLPEV